MNQEKLSGIVMEVDSKNFIILTNDGDFKKIKRKNTYNPQVGEEVAISKVDVLTKNQHLTTTFCITILTAIFLIVSKAFR